MNRKNSRWLAIMAVGLVALTAIILAIHYAIFRDARNLFFYLLLDIGFLPLQVLIVGLILERIVSMREKRTLAHKLNMVIGAFFSELGTPLLAELLPTMEASAEIRQRLHLQASWKKDDFSRASQFARGLTCAVDLGKVDLSILKSHLLDQRQFILRLLENPNLLEHDRFTDLLWAVLHVEEELEARTSLTALSTSDEAHLELDVRRAFTQVLAEWVLYVSHLKENYPYLFSLVMRIHPFQESPSPVIV